MATKAKRINRRKIAVIQAYAIIAIFVFFGAISGFLVGRFTAPPKIETVTITKAVNVPTYEADHLPTTSDVVFFDVPLSHSLQRYIYEVCSDNGVPVTLVMSMIDTESSFNPETVSKSDDYGLMQINSINHEQLAEEYRCADMLDPYQNIFCGVKIIKSYLDKYDNDFTKALMAYNMGDYGARKAWSNGVTSTDYTVKVLGCWEYYEEELRNAESAGNE